MASYIPGVTDYIPQIQPFHPDLNFYGNALQVKQGQYDAAHKQVSSVYGTLLNSPMLRDSNIQRRDEFFKVIDGDLKKMAGMDLSLPENVQAAMSIFKPFYEDDNMVKDMTWTKQYQKELQRAENFRSCIDPEKCGGQYWDGGVRALHYKADEFRKASDADALAFSNAQYTPFVNVTEKALKAAKEAGFNIKIDESKGGYIVTTKNGQLLEAPLQSFFTSMFGNDPKVMDMFRTQAYLARKDFVAGNATAMGGEQQAEEAYLRSFMTNTAPKQAELKQETESTYQSLLLRKQAMDDKISQEGVILNSEEHREYIDLQTQLEAAKGSADFQAQSGNLMETAAKSTDINMLRGNIDDLVAQALFSNEMANAAHTFAYRDYEVSRKADPYALASYNSKLSLQNSLTLKEADYQYWMRKEQFKVEQERQFRMGSADENNFVFDRNAPGTGTDEITNTLNENVSQRNKLYGENRNNKQDFLISLASTLQSQYLSAKTGSDRNMVREAANAIFKGTGLDVNAILSGDATNSVMSINNGAIRRGENGRKGRVNVDEVYDRALKVADPHTPMWSALTKNWSNDFWEKTEQTREAVKNQQLIINEYDKFYKTQADKTLTYLKGNTYAKREYDQAMLDYLVEPSGRLRSKKEFADAWGTYGVREWAKFWGKPDPLTAKLHADDPNFEESYRAELLADPYGSKAEARRKEAEKYYDELAGNYEKAYKTVGVTEPWDGVAGLTGTGGSGKASMKFGIPKVDAYNYESQGAAHSRSFFANYNAAKSAPGTKVFFGGADEKEPTDDASARAVVDQLMIDFTEQQKTPKRDRAVFSLDYQNIAGYSKDRIGVTIKPSQEWIDRHKGTKSSPGITAEKDWSKGITIYIPADEANNSLRNATKFNEYDFIMEKSGSLNLNSYPNAGEIKVSKKGNNYYATGVLRSYDQNGNPVTESINEQYQVALNPSVIYNEWNHVLKELSTANSAYSGAIKQAYGVKNPAALLQNR